ncbi:hypothetical protein LTR53_018099 [Teratosphaeriaceae sp. CCFEE 6253]|nr:hypothetical protein LTR53_018099 [Teratosphaeriaceae sp. CCFEE 6253]
MHSPTYKSLANGNGWICDKDTSETCRISASLLANPASWTIPDVNLLTYAANGTQLTCFKDAPCENVDAPMAYCKARWYGEACQVKAGTTILAVVIACNAVKLLCILVVIFSRHFTPLATLGDALESFLERPEAATAHDGPRSMEDYRQKQQGRASNAEPFRLRTQRWGHAVAWPRWTIGIGLCLTVWLAGLVLLIAGSRDNVLGDPANLWAGGLGAVNPNNLIQPTQGLPADANILIANAPQLLLSLAYLGYNNILTCMLLAREWAGFLHYPRALRVSDPRGQQQSTYWLQLPYPYSVPLLTTMALRHWAVGRSLFLVEIVV